MRTRIHPYGILLCLALMIMLAAAGCSSGNSTNVNPTGNFVANFTGFTPHIGSNFYLKVVDTTTGTTAGTVTPFNITADAFSVSLPGIITNGHNYNIDFWVDTDANGTLDHSPIGTPVGVDHSWRKTGVGTATGLTLAFTHDTNWTDITPF